MDLGTRLHVNNARYLSYLEDTRIAYRKHLDLPGEVGVILADTHIIYLKPIFLDDRIEVGVKVAKIGTKSLTFQHAIVDQNSEIVYATAHVVMVTYDYQTDSTIPVPDSWRTAIINFEGL